MPQIGRIDVPEALWKELVRFEILCTPLMILEHLGDAFSTFDMPAKKEELGLALGNTYDVIADQLITLIREQTNSQLSDGDIERSEDFLRISQLASRLGNPISFDAMFNINNLRALADAHIKNMDVQTSLAS